MALDLDYSTLTAPPLEAITVTSSAWTAVLVGDSGSSAASARVLLERVLAWGPGPDALAALMFVEVEHLSAYDQVTYLQALEAHAGWVEAKKQAAILAVAGAGAARDCDTREEVALALKLAPSTAQRRIDTARTLAEFLPQTRAALLTGQLSGMQAVIVAESLDQAFLVAGWNPRRADGGSVEESAQGLQLAEAVEAGIFPRAHTQTLAELRRSVNRAVARLRPDDHLRAAATAAAARSVHVIDRPDCMATVIAELPAVEAQLVWLALTSTAKADPRDLPIDAKRADALTAWATATLTGASLSRAATDSAAAAGDGPGNPPTTHRRPITAHITLDLATALGLADNPGELTGYGPIPGPLARLLAADAGWRRFTTEPGTDYLVNYGRDTYLPPQDLRDFLVARDRSCAFPGCNRSSTFAEADHTIPWPAGDTSAANLRMVCKRHHQLKTHHGWAYVTNPDHSTTWTSPAGHTYTHLPDP